MALPDFTNQDNTTYKTNIDATAADHELRIVDVESNPNQASTALGGTGTEDGANTWAKLAEFTLNTAERSAQASYVLLDTYSGANNSLSFVITLYAGAANYGTGQSSIVVTDNQNPASGILSTGLKLVGASAANGTTIELWAQKETTTRRFVLKELAKVNFTTVSYFTDSAWQSADPGSGAAFEVISEAGGAPGVLETGSNQVIKTKIIEIGDWDMDATSTVSIAHGLTATNIRSISATIRRDDDALTSDFAATWTSGGTGSHRVYEFGGDIILIRQTAGFYDIPAFSSTSFNRGWIIIQYV